jgi:hypothetical protein
MYLSYMQYWAHKNRVKEITMKNFCEEIFPLGFPKKEDLHTLWNDCKVHTENRGGSDNLLDYQKAYTSIL